MKIELRLFASLRQYIPDNIGGEALIINVSDGTTIRDILRQFKVPEDVVKLVFLNGVHARMDDILKDGDRLGIFPPVAGG